MLATALEMTSDPFTPRLMPQTLSFATYRVRTLEKGSSKGDLVLSALPDGKDLLDLVDVELAKLEAKPHTDPEHATQIRVARVEKIGDRTRYILVKAGGYGFTAEGRDVATDKLKWTQATSDVRLVPFHLLLHLPLKARSGILLVQRLSNQSPYSELTRVLTSAIALQLADIRLDISRCIPNDLAEAIEKSPVKGLELILSKNPTDPATSLGLLKNPDEVRRVSIELRAGRNRSLSLSRPLATVARDADFSAITIPGYSLEPHQVIAEIEYEGRRRKLLLGAPEMLAPYWDVTSELTLGTDGHATEKSFKELALSHVVSLSNDLGVPTP